MTIDEMLAFAKAHPMDDWERRAQAISFVVGNILIDRSCADEWSLRLTAARVYDQQHGTLIEMEAE